MKIGIINCISLVLFDETSLEYGVGGSQTWCICLANELRKKNFDVTIIAQCRKPHIASNGIKWLPFSALLNHDGTVNVKIIEDFNFDNVIVSRPTKPFLNRIINTVRNLFIVYHGINEGLNSPDTLFLHEHIKKVIALTKWHKKHINEHLLVPSQKIVVVPNGINPYDFDSIIEEHSIDHSILWSSEPKRGLQILTSSIVQKAQKTISDFSLIVSTPSYCHIACNRFNFTYKGHLSKKRLYEEMSKHGVWFYPSIYKETFCITAIEAIMCGNIPVLPIKYGPEDIFEDFKESIGMKYDFDVNYEEAVEEATCKICGNILDYQNKEKQNLRKELKSFVLNNFTWSKVAERYVELFNEL